MTEALVTPNVVTWARQRRGMEVADLASKLNVKPEAIDAWETGEKRPTFRQAQRIAQALYVPFGYLYMSEPPIEELPLPDFRTTPSQSPRKPSPDLLDLLNDVMGKQQWFRGYRESEGAEVPFADSFNSNDLRRASVNTSIATVANDIRRTIDFDGARRRSSNRKQFLREFTSNAERAGIMVMRSGVVGNNVRRPLDPGEFSGFALLDDTAPLVFINARGYTRELASTLAHELTHIWIRESSICDSRDSREFGAIDNPVERFCDQVADESLGSVSDYWEGWEDTNRESYMLSNEPPDTDGPAPNVADKRIDAFCQILTARNGVAFTEAVISSASGGTLLSSEAASLLGVKVKTLSSIARHLYGSPLNLG